MVALHAMAAAAASAALGALILGTRSVRAAQSPLQPIPYNISFPDTASILTYTPSKQAVASRGWNTTFSGDATQWSSYVANTIGQGNSTTSTSYAGARVDIIFAGTGATFEGTTANGGTVALLVDGFQQSYVTADPGNVAAVSGLSHGQHNVSIVLVSGTVSLTGVTLTMGLYAQSSEAIAAASASPTTIDFEKVVSGTAVINSVVTTGNASDWTPNSVLGGGGGYGQQAYDRIGSNIEGATAMISLGTGNTFVLLSGSSSSDHGLYTVQLDPPPPDLPESQVLTSYNPWTVANSTLFAAGLLPNTTYNLTMTVGAGGWSDVGTAQLWSVGNGTGNATDSGGGTGEPSGSSGSKSNIGAIVGGVVGGVVAIALIGALAWFLIRKRKRASNVRSVQGRAGYPVIDDDDSEVRYSPIATDVPASQITPYDGTASQSGTTRSADSRSRDTAQYTSMTGLRVQNADDEGASFLTQTTSNEKNSRRNRPRALIQTHEEVDAGPVVRSVAVPPRYDPTWAASTADPSEGTATPPTVFSREEADDRLLYRE